MDRKWWTLIVVCTASFMLLLDITIVNVALPKIAADLHASFSQIQWVIDANALTLASALLTAGALADLLGRRLVFAIGLGLFSRATGGAADRRARDPCRLHGAMNELTLVSGVAALVGAALALALVRGRDFVTYPHPPPAAAGA
jgi:MFS family permease